MNRRELENALVLGDLTAVLDLMTEDDLPMNDYEMFAVAAKYGHVHIIKDFLARQVDHTAMISADKFCCFRWAVWSGHAAVVDLLISVCDKQLLKNMISANNFDACRWYGGYGDGVTERLVYAASIGLQTQIDRLGYTPVCRPRAAFCDQITAAITYTALPALIMNTLRAGRGFLGWVLAAKNASLAGLPGEIIGEILSQIDPRWRSIIAAMQPKERLHSDIPFANIVLCRARFLQTVLASCA